MVRGLADFPFTRQYRNTTPYLYFIEQQVVWGIGSAVGIGGPGGEFVGIAPSGCGQSQQRRVDCLELAHSLFRADRARFWQSSTATWSPVLPFVVLFAAGLVFWLMGKLRPAVPTCRSPNLGLRVLGWGLGIVALLGGLFWSVAYVNGVYGNEHTWLQASRWVYANAPRDSIILWESWDDPLPKSTAGEQGTDMGRAGLRHIDWSPYEEDTPRSTRFSRRNCGKRTL